MESSSLRDPAPPEARQDNYSRQKGGACGARKAAPPEAGAKRHWIWPYSYGHNRLMKTIAAGKFKDICLQTLDEVAANRQPVVITKRGRPVAKLVPIAAATRARSLVGSIISETDGDVQYAWA